MAETLGSLIDKLTIKDIREFHLVQMLESGDTKFKKKELEGKLSLVQKQKRSLAREIDGFVALAVKTRIVPKDEKLKLYNSVKDMGRILKTHSLGQAVSGLSQKNLELWHLEDEARRSDVDLSVIGKVKQQIDRVNQQRNDFIDRIDELFEGLVLKMKK